MLSIELRDLIRDIVNDEFQEIYGIACKTSNVHEDDDLGYVCDCDPVNGKPKIIDVRLRPEKDGEILILPKDDSIVFVTMESETQAFVSMFGQIDSIQWFDGSNGGLIKASELVDKLNVLEERMFSHQHLSASPASPTTVDPATNPQIIETTVEDLENPLILH